MAGTLGREVGDAFDEVYALFLSDLTPDTYQIERTVSVSDGYGGTTEQDSIVESDDCRLKPTARLGSEGVSGNTIESSSAYVLFLPRTTTLTAADTVIINGDRRFAVVSEPRRGGNWKRPVVADVEERV